MLLSSVYVFLSSSCSEVLYSLVYLSFIIAGKVLKKNEDVNNEENRFALKLLANQSRYLKKRWKMFGIIAAVPLTQGNKCRNFAISLDSSRKQSYFINNGKGFCNKNISEMPRKCVLSKMYGIFCSEFIAEKSHRVQNEKTFIGEKKN